ncbi:MAG: hypothetical protein WA988_12915 [Candidatus Nanopelagicales bacterium]
MDLFTASPSVLLLALVAAIAALAKTVGDLLDARAEKRVTMGTILNLWGAVTIGLFTATGVGIALHDDDQFSVFLLIVLGLGLVLPVGTWVTWRTTPAKLKRPIDH